MVLPSCRNSRRVRKMRVTNLGASPNDGACNSQHLLLAPAERSGHLVSPLGEHRKTAEGLGNVAPDLAIGTHIGAHTEIVEDAHALENGTALRHMAQSQRD